MGKLDSNGRKRGTVMYNFVDHYTLNKGNGK